MIRRRFSAATSSSKAANNTAGAPSTPSKDETTKVPTATDPSPAASSATNTPTSSSGTPRLAGFGKSFRRISFHFSAGQKEIDVEAKETEEEASKNRPMVAGDEPIKKTSTVEDEPLSKILHRRSRPRSNKFNSVRLSEQIEQQRQQYLAQQAKQGGDQEQQQPSSPTASDS